MITYRNNNNIVTEEQGTGNQSQSTRRMQYEPITHTDTCYFYTQQSSRRFQTGKTRGENKKKELEGSTEKLTHNNYLITEQLSVKCQF